MYGVITVSEYDAVRSKVFYQYSSFPRVEKTTNIEVLRWYPSKSFPNADGTLEEIPKVFFESVEIQNRLLLENDRRDLQTDRAKV